MAIPFWLRKYVLCFSSERQILDLIWNLPALDVRHVPEWGYCTSNLWQKCPLYGCYAMGRLIAWEIHYRPYKIFVFFGDSQTGFVTPKVPRHPKALFSKSVIFWQRSFGSPQCQQKVRVIFYKYSHLLLTVGWAKRPLPKHNLLRKQCLWCLGTFGVTDPVNPDRAKYIGSRVIKIGGA